MKKPPKTSEWNHRNAIITAAVAILTFSISMGLLESWDDFKTGFMEGWEVVIKK